MKKKFKSEQWDPRKEKKARFKRKISRIKKRGQNIYGGYIKIDDTFDLSQ